MSANRTIARQPAPPERRPATVAPARNRVAAAPSPAQLLQRRLGNEATAAFVARSSLQVSSPHDPAEREATAKAAEVMRMPSAGGAAVTAGWSGVQRCSCDSCSCPTEVQREAAGPPAASPGVSEGIRANMSGGSPLPATVRSFMEPRFGADFSAVRIHTGEQSAGLSANLNARAFTVGNHVFFGRGEYRPETETGKELIAHELTHTIQQGGSVKRAASTGGILVQRDEKKSWWQRIKDGVAEWGESVAWDMVRAVAPADAMPIIQKGAGGVLDWIKEKVSSAADAAFNTLMAPVRAIAGVGETLSSLFAPIVATVRVAATQIANNDCSPIRQAAEKIEQTAIRIITPIVEKLQPVVAKVKGFLNDLWDKIGAPIWELIQKYAKMQWDALMWWWGVIKGFYVYIWDKTEVVRETAARAWDWIKNKLGLGDSPEGQDGLLQWIQRKAEAAWGVLKQKLEPFKQELTAIGAVVGGVLVAVSPAGPIMAVGAAVSGAVQGLRWVAANWGKGDAMVQARVYLEKTLIPPLVNAVKSLGAAITRMAASIANALQSLSATMTRAAATLGGTIFNFLVTAVQWLADQAIALAAWANQQLNDLTHWLTGALVKLQEKLNQMLALLKKLGGVILDIYSLPFLLGETVWDMIPACIRDPIVDFLGPIILRQIELFSELGKDAAAWQQTKADVMKIIHLVFKNHDLIGAVKAAFLLILRVFNIPPDLLTKVYQKAMAAWNVVSKKPLDFIKNTVRSLGAGFKLLWDNLWEDLGDGLQGWLFGELKEQKINPPASWTSLKDLFLLAMEILGLSVDHIWFLIGTKFGEAKTKALRGLLGTAKRVIDWVNNAIDLTKTPKQNAEGIWNQAKEFGGTIITGITEWVVGKVAEELAIMATAAAASGGLSEVLDVLRRVYKALVTAKRYARRILDMVHQGLDYVLDIAAGNVMKVGVLVHKLMKMGMPVVIGFLAEQVGLGGVGAEIRKIVTGLRASVDDGILWFLDKIKAGIEALVGAVKAGVAAVVDWWRERRNFSGADGAPHSVYVEGGEHSPRLIVASAPKEAADFLKQTIDQAEVGSTLKAAGAKAHNFYVTNLWPVLKKDKGSENLAQSFSSNLSTFSQMLAEIVGAGEAGPVVPVPVGSWIGTVTTQSPGKASPYEQVTSSATLKIRSGGAEYPVTFSTAVPDGGTNSFRYKEEGKAWVRTTFTHGSKHAMPSGPGKFQLAKATERDGEVIRKIFYGDTQSSRDRIVAGKLPALRNPANPAEFLSEGDPSKEFAKRYKIDSNTGRALVPVSAASPDHDPPVAQHWTGNGGNNTSQADREKWNATSGTYKIMSEALNFSLGSRGWRYTHEVGINFRGPGE